MTEPTTDTKPVRETRIPAVLAKQSILADFCRQYLTIFDEISGYNKDVLAEKSSEWTTVKVLEKAREMGSPENAEETDEEIKTALNEWEAAVTAMNLARRNVLDKTSKKLGITLSATAERNPEIEAPLKEKRKIGIELGTQLSMIAKMTTDDKAADAVTEFLGSNPLPAIGRDQVRSFGENEKSTPKYRVTVVVKNKDGETVVDEKGFTKAALALTKPVCGYERGKAPKSDVLREAWEKAGNSADETKVNPVEFDDNNLHFIITKN